VCECVCVLNKKYLERSFVVEWLNTCIYYMVLVWWLNTCMYYMVDLYTIRLRICIQTILLLCINMFHEHVYIHNMVAHIYIQQNFSLCICMF